MFEERISKIIDSDLDPSEIGMQEVKDILEFDKYKPIENIQSPHDRTHKYENPAIDYYCSELDWDNGWHPISEIDILRCFPEYVPTDEAIDVIKKYDPILEIGAGRGYWSYVLDKAGCDIIPTDMIPYDIIYDKHLPDDYFDNIGSSEYNMLEVNNRHGKNCETPYVDIGESKPPSVPWTKVNIADHSVVNEYPDHTILICHPTAEPWTEDMLDDINKSQKLILVAEWYPGADATPAFYHKLKQWDLLETFPVYDWKSQHVNGYIFEK